MERNDEHERTADSTEPTSSRTAIDPPQTATSPAIKPSYIVGVGASAGGLEALQMLFERMPRDTGMAFVVIQHLSPDYKSLMDVLLRKMTILPVCVAENEMELRADAVYLLPPKKEMIVASGKLLLTERQDTDTLNLPINTFLRSLAESYQERGIAIILSGTGSDGSEGIKLIHDNGGMVIAQTPESSQFDGMPKSAIATGRVDLTTEPSLMPDGLVKYAKRTSSVTEQLTGSHFDAEENRFSEIVILLNNRYGLDFSQYKPSTITRRIERRLNIQNCKLREYIDILATNSNELDTLYRDLLIGVTSFFRDHAAFKSLRSELIRMLDRFADEPELRVWVAGCASGQEAYTLAMLFDDVIRKSNHKTRIKIFATDMHGNSIEHAAQGVYTEQELKGLNEDFIQRYFICKLKSKQYQVKPDIRRTIVFAQHNVLSDPPFTKLHLITCRNMMIYFNLTAQQRVLSLFTFALKRDGWLFLGPSETLGRHEHDFKCIDQIHRIFQKQRNSYPDPKLAFKPRTGQGRRHQSIIQPGGKNPLDMVASARSKRGLEALLQRHVPPSVLIDDHGEVLHVFGAMGEFLSLDIGCASLNLPNLVGDPGRDVITQMIGRVKKTRKSVRASKIKGFVRHESVDIEVSPLSDGPEDVEFMLVSFVAVAPKAEAESSPVELNLAQLSVGDSRRVRELEDELQFAKENLQSTVEELETSNEELQATNEELMAANEELQSTNEELQSVNEELLTVNAEFQTKERQRAEAEADERSIIEYSGIGIIFLDAQLNIRKYSHPAAELFQLSDGDLGFPFAATASAKVQHVLADLNHVLNEGGAIEKKLKAEAGQVHRIQIRRLESVDGASAAHRGVILTITNISKLHGTQQRLERSEERLQSVLDSLTDGYIEWTPGQDTPFLSASVLESLGYPGDDRVDWKRLLESDRKAVLDQFNAALKTGKKVELILPLRRADGERHWMLCKGVFLDQKQGDETIARFSGQFVDMQTFKQMEQDLHTQMKDLARSNEILEEFAHIVSHDLKAPLRHSGHSLRFLKEALDENDDQTAESELNNMFRHMGTLQSLIDDVIRFSRVSSEKKHETTVDLGDVIARVREILGPTIAERNITLHCDELPSVRGDKGMLSHLFQNLIGNACKYNDKETPLIEVSHQKIGGNCVIHVKDNGIGFDPTHAANIFKPFKRLVTQEQYEGSGIGLAICKILVEQHYGEIYVESAPGQGSTFTVKLPLARKHVHANPLEV